MKKLFIICILFLVSCTGTSDKKEKNLIGKNDFESQLTLKYIKYSKVLSEKNIKDDAKYFYKKSKNVAKLDDNKLLEINFNKKILFSEKTKFELLDYKDRLIELVDNDDLKNTQPINIADIYFFFNCWSYYAFKNTDINQANYCKKNFTTLFFKLEREYKELNKIFYKENVDNRLTAEEKIFFENFNNENTINIYFDLNKYSLNNTALKELKNFLKYLSTITEDYRIVLSGNTDRSGNVIYNNRLAKRRSNAVYNVLVKNGVPADLIVIKNVSSKEPSVLTETQKVNALNRRVEIKLEKNFKDSQRVIPQPMDY